MIDVSRSLWYFFALFSILGVYSPIRAQESTSGASLCLEVDSDHPLFVFAAAHPQQGQIDAQTVARIWETCPNTLKPFSLLEITLPTYGEASGFANDARNVLETLQTLNIPIALVISDRHPTWMLPAETLAEIMDSFTCVRAVVARGVSFNEYYLEWNMGSETGESPPVRWLRSVLRVVPQYGRLFILTTQDLDAPRMMSNPSCSGLYQECRDVGSYIIPLVSYRGNHLLPQLSSIMGFWLEKAVSNWGIGPDSRWYQDARCISPGIYGITDRTDAMPPALYRAMILNGVMTGSCVFLFEQSSDLWYADQSHYWEDAILPTLLEILYKRLIPDRETVLKKVQAVYQLALSRTPEGFHLNLRDIDGEFDQGLLVKGAYGLEYPGLVSEFIPNSGRHYWIPFVSAFAPTEGLQQFSQIFQPGIIHSAQDWTETLDRLYQPDGEGSAFITRVGRSIFVFNTKENSIERQPFRLAAVPTPLRSFEAHRTPNGISLSWPFREGDVGYRVYRRIPPQKAYYRIADDLSQRTWVDTSVGEIEQVAYAVTALTNEEEPYEGMVEYGEYLALSTVESRIAEEVVLGPLLETAFSRPVETPATFEELPETWWITKESATNGQMAIMEKIAALIEAWERAFAAEDLDNVLAIYHPDYQDPEGWQIQYVRRAYQWFFERYNTCKMSKQVRQWVFPPTTSDSTEINEVELVMYCRFSGVAISDSSGRVGSQAAFFPRVGNGEVRLRFIRNGEGDWKMIRSDPAVPNFKDILSFSTGPFDRFTLGKDFYAP